MITETVIPKACKAIPENNLTEKVDGYFSRWFDIYPEVGSDEKHRPVKHLVPIARLDRIFQDKVTEVCFGIECKRPGNQKGSPLNDIISQAIQYSRLSFGGKRIPIFLIPSISHNQLASVQRRIVNQSGEEWIRDKHDTNHIHHTVNGFLGSFNVGEVRKFKDDNGDFYYSFCFSNQCIYSTKKFYNSGDIEGLNHENYTELIRKINQWEQTSRIFKVTQQPESRSI